MASPDSLSSLLPRLAQAEEARKARAEGQTCVVTNRTEDLDGNGRVKGWREVVTRRVMKAGHLSSEVLRATRDGRDVTEETRRKREEASRKQEKGSGFAFGGLPFESALQPGYVFESRGADARDPKRLRIAFRPKAPREDLLAGEALVDVEHAALLRIDGRPSKLPAMTDRADVTVEFGAETPTGRDLTRVEVSGEGGLLFVRKRLHMVNTFVYESP